MLSFPCVSFLELMMSLLELLVFLLKFLITLLELTMSNTLLCKLLLMFLPFLFQLPGPLSGLLKDMHLDSNLVI